MIKKINIQRSLMAQIERMDLKRFKDAEEDVPPEQILYRWFNYHLKNSGISNRQVTNFSSDIQVCLKYIELFSTCGIVVKQKKNYF
jgi:hypothetical protein